MNHLKLIQQFIRERRSFEDIPDYGFPFVTISRQAGAGGHLLSYVIQSEFLKHTASDLYRGWHIFDKQLVEIVAQDPQVQNSMEALLSERWRPEFGDYVESLFMGQSPQYTLYKTTFRVVRMLALVGKVILVGRGAALVTADLPQSVHIRLVAPEAQRIVWMMKRFKLTREEARLAITKQDADRAKLIRIFFHRDVNDPLLYDVVWNSGTVSMDSIAASTIELIQARATRRKKRGALG